MLVLFGIILILLEKYRKKNSEHAFTDARDPCGNLSKYKSSMTCTDGKQIDFSGLKFTSKFTGIRRQTVVWVKLMYNMHDSSVGTTFMLSYGKKSEVQKFLSDVT